MASVSRVPERCENLLFWDGAADFGADDGFTFFIVDVDCLAAIGFPGLRQLEIPV